MKTRKQQTDATMKSHPSSIQNLVHSIASRKWVRFFLNLFLPILLTLFTYKVFVPFLGSSKDEMLLFLRAILAERGFIPPVIVFCFWITLIVLFVRTFVLAWEFMSYDEAVRIIQGSTLEKGLVWSDAGAFKNLFQQKKYKRFEKALIFSRISNGMDRLVNAQDTNALADYFKTSSEIEYSEKETTYTEVRYLIWLIPTLGFIGTVLGIGKGIAGFADIINRTQFFEEVRQHLPTVTHNLGVAFDTTFLALILSVIAVYLTSLVSKKNDQLLEQIDAFCLDDVCSYFRLHSTSAEQITQFLQNVLLQEIHNDMVANKQEVVNVLRDHIVGHLEDFKAVFKGILQSVDDGKAVRDQMKSIAESFDRLSSAHEKKKDEAGGEAWKTDILTDIQQIGKILARIAIDLRAIKKRDEN